LTLPTNREISVKKEKILSVEISCTVEKVSPETRIRWRRSVASSQKPTRVRNGEGFGDPLAEETSATTS
jgi:hypothetical protein